MGYVGRMMVVNDHSCQASLRDDARHDCALLLSNRCCTWMWERRGTHGCVRAAAAHGCANGVERKDAFERLLHMEVRMAWNARMRSSGCCTWRCECRGTQGCVRAAAAHGGANAAERKDAFERLLHMEVRMPRNARMRSSGQPPIASSPSLPPRSAARAPPQSLSQERSQGVR
jgi:hypothetical protein